VMAVTTCCDVQLSIISQTAKCIIKHQLRVAASTSQPYL